jgi:hypothetical protein
LCRLTRLAVAKGLAELVDRAAAGGQQPLHGVLRRALQEARRIDGAPCAVSGSMAGSVTP